jgi:hypothetical protein
MRGDPGSEPRMARRTTVEWEFDKKRPWRELLVHELVVKHGVTIFFQGSEHLFARQKKDGVLYRATPDRKNGKATFTYTITQGEKK